MYWCNSHGPAGANVDSYILRVGTSFGGTDVYSRYVTGGSRWLEIPLTENPIYVRLESKVDDVWIRHNYQFDTTNGGTDPAAILTSPRASTVLSNTLVTFEWSNGSGVDAYILRVGTTAGGRDIYSRYVSSGSQSVDVPIAGDPVYVRLESRVNGVWLKRDYRFDTTAAGVDSAAVLTSPADGTVLSTILTDFTWSDGSGVDSYILRIGTVPGGTDVYSKYV